MSKKNARKKKKTAGASKRNQAAKERRRLVGEHAAALYNLAQVGVFFAPFADASEETRERYQNNYPLHLLDFANKHFDTFGAESIEESTEAWRRQLEMRRMAPEFERIGIRLVDALDHIAANSLEVGLLEERIVMPMGALVEHHK